jgi:hypothetical protein
MRVILTDEALLYLDELAHKLYFNHYFGFEASAQRYVDELIDDIKTNLPSRPFIVAPPYFNRYGRDMSYATFRKNKNTHWYVFFRKYRPDGEIVFQVRYITNNHLSAQYL